MKKIILASDGLHFPKSGFHFVTELNELNRIYLTGVFLPQISYANVWSYANGMGAPVFVPALGEAETATIESNIELFSQKCTHVQMDFSIRKDFSDLALPELKKESRYADLMIIDSDAFYGDMGTGSTDNYLRDTLHQSECPVIVVPDSSAFPKEIILTYDGSEESVFSIRQFSYLFPEFSDFPVTLLYISESSKADIPKEAFIEEWASRHFSNLTITSLKMDAGKYFATWMGDKKESLLVSGSFSRSGVSQLLRKSFVKEVIEAHKVPVFIAHK